MLATGPQGKSLEYFFNVSIYNYKLPLSTAFAVAHKFWNVVFLFSFISKYFPISLVISLPDWLLFNFCRIFQFFLMLLISNCSSWWSEKVLWMLPFKIC